MAELNPINNKAPGASSSPDQSAAAVAAPVAVASAAPAVAPAPARVPASAPSGGAVLTCTACGGENSLDSHYCRHCGASLLPAGAQNGSSQKPPAAQAPTATAPARSTPPPPVVASATGQNGKAAPAAAAQPRPAAAREADAPEADEPELSPQEIDARRSRQLLDRALGLSEQGDRASAMLSCRQAIALAPNAPGGFSMLGLLLERNGDLKNAIAAYEKVLELSPNSPLERDSLHRLRAAIKQNKASRIFHFNSTELFNPDADDAPDIVSPAADSSTSAAAAPTAATPVATAATLAGSVAPPPSVIGANAAMTVPAIAPLAGLRDDYLLDDTPKKDGPGLLRVLRKQNSFYVQALPLMGVSIVAIGFLLWARSIAVTRAMPAVEVNPNPNNIIADPVNNPVPGNAINPTSGQTNAPPAPNNQFTFPVTNGAPQPPVPGAPAAPANGAQTPAAPRSAAAPRFPRVPAGQTAPARPATAREEGEEVFGNLKPFPVNSTVAEPAPTPFPVLPAGGNNDTVRTGRSSNGSPFSSDGAGPRGYVRVTGQRVPVAAAPPRPENRIRATEDSARDDAASGHTDRAIEKTTSAIDSGRGGDTGWRYQQRALLHLERGDNNQAIDDFQTAIAAYRDQINRNVRPDEARSGITACQSGLRLAQSRAN